MSLYHALLPNEVWANVVRFVPATQDLQHLSIISRRFNEISEPFLFRHVEILDSQQAVVLAAAIKSKANRALWIKTLLVSTKYEQEKGSGNVLPPPNTLPTIIPLMSNLKTLRLETPDLNQRVPEERVAWVSLQQRYERVFQLASAAVPNTEGRLLSSLRDCTLHFVDSERAIYGMSKYATLFLHPDLRTLTISCAATDYVPHMLPTFRDDPSLKGSTALQELHLEECDIHGASLAVLLSFPRALKSLKISEACRYGPPRWGDRKHGDIEPSALTAAMQQHEDSLEHLSLGLGYRRQGGLNFDTPGQYLDLTNFTALRHLELSAGTAQLIRPVEGCDHHFWKRLPPSLISLKVFALSLSGNTLNIETNRLLPFEPCLIPEKRKHGLPNLKTLTYSFEVCARMQLLDEADDDDETGDTQLIRCNKINLARAADSKLAICRKSGVRFIIEIVKLPRGFIPPYLYRENAPTKSILWDSDNKVEIPTARFSHTPQRLFFRHNPAIHRGG